MDRDLLHYENCRTFDTKLFVNGLQKPQTMKHVLQNSKVPLFAGLFIIVIGTSAWQLQTDGKQANESRMQACSDTTRPSTVNPDQIDLGVNVDSIMKAAQTAISAIDFKKLQEEINASIAKINYDEINKNI